MKNISFTVTLLSLSKFYVQKLCRIKLSRIKMKQRTKIKKIPSTDE